MNDLKWGVQSWDISEAKYMLDEFLELYGERPLKNNGGGYVVNAFVLDMVCAEKNESGEYY